MTPVLGPASEGFLADPEFPEVAYSVPSSLHLCVCVCVCVCLFAHTCTCISSAHMYSLHSMHL